MNENEKCKCEKCGKDYDESFSFCPYCAEPKKEKINIEKDEKWEEDRDYIKFTDIFSSIIAWTAGGFVGTYVFYVGYIIYRAFETAFDGRAMPENKGWPPIWLALLIGVAFAGCVLIIKMIYYKNRTEEQAFIDVTFARDSTSICPRCGSRDIALGRKGYDWNKGYWYRVFNVKGGHYLAGMDSRRVTCSCKNCGHFWETDREWLK